MQDDLPIWEMFLRLVAAMVGSALVGWERRAKEKPAGLRTHMLVGLGACGFTVVSVAVLTEMSAGAGHTQADPLRMIHGVAMGVGFLGAGAIFRSGTQVHGLTTAAGIWVAAAIGAAMGLGEYAIGTALVLLALFTLTVVGMIERHFEAIDEGEDN